MANTYAWTINALDAKISHDNNDNVVTTVHYTYTVTDDNDNTSSIIGTHSVEYDADNFTEYDNLTEANIISWLEDADSGLDITNLKSNLDAQVALVATPVNTTFHTPFASTD